MDEKQGWRELARVRASDTLRDTAAQFDALAGSPEERAARIEQWKKETSDRRGRDNIPAWAPLDACDLYFRLSDVSSRRDESDGCKYALLRSLLTAPAMKLVWSSLEKNEIDCLSFAMDAFDLAKRCVRGVGAWDAQSKAERAKQSMEVASAARDLAKKLQATPSAWSSAFDLFPDGSAEEIAAHALKNLSGPIWRVPDDPRIVIEDALPPAPLFVQCLEELALRADRWANASPPYGKKNDTQHARAFVVRLSAILHEKYKQPMRKEVGETCHVLLGISFETSQLRALIP